MIPDDVDRLLESKFLTYADLSTIQAHDNHDPMVEIGETYGIATSAVDGDMLPYTGNGIWVRSTVAQKLQEAQLFLKRLLPTAELQVVYGYRHLDVQRKAYERIRQDLLLKKQFRNEEELKEMAHISIAVPEVSGHPTGGAVDLHILMNASPLDMGTDIHDFSSLSYSFSPYVSKEAWYNRQLLRICMTSAGFAPFDGEWWHFSYGDKEWAKFYEQPFALYEQIEFTPPKQKL